MTDKDTKIEEQTQPTSRTQRFAEWLMTREERRQERESNIEQLIKLNLLVSFLTLGVVGGFEMVRTAVTLVPYL
jgi:hypothetical protein